RDDSRARLRLPGRSGAAGGTRRGADAVLESAGAGGDSRRRPGHRGRASHARTPAVVMPVDIVMPRLSDTMTEGTVARWLKKPGDHVAKGEVIAEIETDKALMQYESFEEGT